MKIGIIGGLGRMGQELIKAILDSQNLILSGVCDKPNNNFVDQDISSFLNTNHQNIKLSNHLKDFIKESDILIDFSNPESSINNIKLAIEFKKPIVIGTTGFNDSQNQTILESAKQIAILKSANMSLGINLLLNLVGKISKSLPKEDFNIEIVESHHKNKLDGPSGTAISLGKEIANARAVDLDINESKNKIGISKNIRDDNNIGFSVIRGGGIFGEHSVLFLGDDEAIEIKHTALNRSLFAKGAIFAAKWLINQNAGKLYSIKDALNFK